MLTRPIESAVFNLSMRAHVPGNMSERSHHEATFSTADYQLWRQSELETQFAANFNAVFLHGKRVLDFGCGSGDLSFFAAKAGAADVIGTELSQKDVALAERERVRLGLSNVRIIREPDPKVISLPDQSVDTILCFDVLEHVMDYEQIVHEWRRVLAPAGRILIWWVPYWHPYGHHLHTMIPLPWVHAILNDAALSRVCARIYDNPNFQPRIWHYGADGKRLDNPYRNQTRFGDLNKLTIRKFEQTARRAGLKIDRREFQPFTGDRLARLKRALIRLPWPDAFTSCVVYEITLAAERS